MTNLIRKQTDISNYNIGEEKNMFSVSAIPKKNRISISTSSLYDGTVRLALTLKSCCRRHF